MGLARICQIKTDTDFIRLKRYIGSGGFVNSTPSNPVSLVREVDDGWSIMTEWDRQETSVAYDRVKSLANDLEKACRELDFMRSPESAVFRFPEKPSHLDSSDTTGELIREFQERSVDLDIEKIVNEAGDRQSVFKDGDVSVY